MLKRGAEGLTGTDVLLCIFRFMYQYHNLLRGVCKAGKKLNAAISLNFRCRIEEGGPTLPYTMPAKV